MDYMYEYDTIAFAPLSASLHTENGLHDSFVLARLADHRHTKHVFIRVHIQHLLKTPHSVHFGEPHQDALDRTTRLFAETDVVSISNHVVLDDGNVEWLMLSKHPL
jgi:hypothetical protein